MPGRAHLQGLARPGRGQPVTRIRRGLGRAGRQPDMLPAGEASSSSGNATSSPSMSLMQPRTSRSTSSIRRGAAALFVEPVIPGYDRVNLAELSRGASEGLAHHGRDRRCLRRQPRNGVKLGRPTSDPG